MARSSGGRKTVRLMMPCQPSPLIDEQDHLRYHQNGQAEHCPAGLREGADPPMDESALERPGNGKY